MRVWRDVDSPRPRVGIQLWMTGGEISLGRKLWRWKYGRP